MFVVIIPIEQFKTINKLSYENTFFFLYLTRNQISLIHIKIVV